jgi:hypothetical protein
MEVRYTGKHIDRIRKIRDYVQNAKHKYSQYRIFQMESDSISEVLHVL